MIVKFPFINFYYQDVSFHSRCKVTKKGISSDENFITSAEIHSFTSLCCLKLIYSMILFYTFIKRKNGPPTMLSL